MFGEFIKERRLKLNLSLREFSKKLGEDPSNWSKVERGLLDPPQSLEKLKKIATVLHFPINSPEFEELQSIAAVKAGNIPGYITSDGEIMKALPAFFRTVKNVKPTQAEILQLIEKLKGRR